MAIAGLGCFDKVKAVGLKTKCIYKWYKYVIETAS